MAQIFRKKIKNGIGGLLLLLGLLFSPPSTYGAAGNQYVIAVLPQAPVVTMHANWTPLVERLERDTGQRFTLRLYERMDDFESDLKKGTADFVYTNPPQTVIARRSQGYIPLVRGSTQLSGVIFVRRDSPIRTVRDLEGKEVAFVGAKNL
jgi:phosphonate transport system substrate-binding protein